MTTTQIITIVLLVIGGIVFGYTTMQSSNSREATYSGMPASIFHWISAGIMSMLAPTMLSSIFIFHLEFMQLLVIAIIIFGTALISLTIFAVFEKPAKEKALREQEDRGWTEEDARTSGL